MNLEIYTPGIWIVLGVFACLGIIIAFFKTCIWFSKSGKQIIDLPTIGKLVLNALGILATFIFLIAAGFSVWLLIVVKAQNNTIEFNINLHQNILKIFLIISFILKTVDIIHIIIRQTIIDIFFIDWERPKTAISNSISAWRTCFVANEFNEIQTFRRVHVSSHLLCTLFFLKVINLESVARVDSNNSATSLSSCTNSTTKYDSNFRCGMAFLVLLGTALIQYALYIILYQRFIQDKIINFVDLCSVSNISVFILDQSRHGYYIHGRSPHGITDVNIKDMIMNLDRESRLMSPTRGLEANSIAQLFIMRINRAFRAQYDSLFRQYSNYFRPKQRQEDKERYADVIHESYNNLNKFLCAFIDHSLPKREYVIRNRYFIEKLFDYEFRFTGKSETIEDIDNIFYVDDEKLFTRILFYGEENSLIIWNIITFLFTDFLSSNYVLAAIITFLLNSIAVALRNSLGRKNLSKKTLVPRELLI